MRLNFEETDLIYKLTQNPRACFFVSHSGGKDSQAMYRELTSRGISKERLIVIHAVLPEVEWAGVIEHVEKYLDHELVKVQSEKTFFGMVRARKMFPSSMIRNCTSDLKSKPIIDEIKRIMRERGFDIAINCIGIRAAESAKRAEQKPWGLNKGSTKNLIIYDYKPIFHWSTREVYRYLIDSGEELHQAYSHGMSRLSCAFCILANRQDLAVSAEHNPALLNTIAELEKEIGHTMFMHDKKPIGIKEYIATPYKRKPKELIRLKDCQ